MNALLIRCSVKEEGQFQVDRNLYFFIGSVLLFNEKPMTVFGQISCICLHTKSHGVQRILCIIRISIFRAFFNGKKCTLYTGKYGTSNRLLFMKHCHSTVHENKQLTCPVIESITMSAKDLELTEIGLSCSKLQEFELGGAVLFPVIIIVGKETNPNSKKKITKFKNSNHLRKIKKDSTPLPKRPQRKKKL